MATSEEPPVEALRALTEYFPVNWDWNAVPGQRIRVRNGMPGLEMLVSVADAVYQAEVQPGVPWVCLAGVNRQADAVDALDVVFRVKAAFAAAGCRCRGTA